MTENVSSESMGKRFCGEDLKKIEDLEKKQTQFRKVVLRSRIYSEIEKKVVNVSSKDEFDNAWNEVNNEKTKFDQNHEKGCGLFSKRYQETGVAILDFMKDFSPILEIVKNFASPYGNIAFGTISVLFAVAKSKHNLEQQFGTAISGIKDRLPGLQVYEHIYNDKKELDIKLQGQIATAYKNFIEYCMLATHYYKKRAVLQWNLELQKVIQNDRVRTFQNALKLSSFSAESQLKDFKNYCDDLNSNEQLNMQYLQQMRGDELQSFKAASEYQAWRVSEESQLLVLWGYNNPSIYQEVECWLSPVATSTINELSQNSFLAYNIVGNEKFAHEIVSVILLQLLRIRSERLNDESQYLELHSDLEEYRLLWNEGERSIENEKAMLAVLQKMAARIASFFNPSETVYIIIDRVDQCSHRKSGTTLNHRKALLDVLVNMVDAASCKLKILAVVNGHDWNLRGYDLDSRKGKRVVIYDAEQELKS
ncbi:hypothetical protein NHQ30_007023 [Ciborinia camelliae]|nr:hypothetical protein NHQ30_007023 [Ciborinia camelliae]